MSVHVLAAVARDSDAKLAARLVLIMLADGAGHDGIVFKNQDTLAVLTRLDVRTVRRAIHDLQEMGEIEVRQAKRGRRRFNVYRVWRGATEPNYEDLPVEIDQPFTSTGGQSDLPSREDIHARREDIHDIDGRTSTAVSGSLSTCSEESHEPSRNHSRAREIVTVDRRAPRPKTVDRRPVTDAEFVLADDVLAEFNRQAGTRFRSADWIAKIVMRLREHPGSDLAQHERVIRMNLAQPWWRGPVSPSVIYGSGAQFERSIAVAEQPLDPNRPLTPDEIMEQANELRRQGR